jgi:hypothetical protein
MRQGGHCIPIAAVVLAASAVLAVSTPCAAQQNPVPFTLSPALPADSDAITIGLDAVVGLVGESSVQVRGNEIDLFTGHVPTSPQPPGTLVHFDFHLPALPAGSYTVVTDVPFLPSFGFAVRPRTATLDLGQRFLVSVTDQQAGATPTAVRLSDVGGYFWFFDPADIEITVKIVDGRAVNNRFWVFIASMTDTPLAVTVTDTSVQGCQPGGSGSSACPFKTYSTTTRGNQNFIDVNAF